MVANPDPGIVSLLAHLAGWKGERYTKALLGIDSTDSRGAVHRMQLHAIGALGLTHSPTAARPLYDILVRSRLFGDREQDELRVAAAQALRTNATPDAMGALREASRHKKRAIRDAVNRVLGRGATHDVDDDRSSCPGSRGSGGRRQPQSPAVRDARSSVGTTLDALHMALSTHFEEERQREVTVGLLGQGLAVLGVPIHDPPSSVVRFMSKLVERDVEIIVIRPGVTSAELETLLSYLGADSADVAAVRADAWLTERGVEHISIKHLQLLTGDGTEGFRDVYFRGKRVLQREFDRVGKGGSVSSAAFGDLAKSLMEIVLEAETPVATLLALKDRDDFSLVHSVNVATLCGSQAGALGLAESEVQAIISAALTHDIGKTKVRTMCSIRALR